MNNASLLRRSPFSITVVVIGALILLIIVGSLLALFVGMLGRIGGMAPKPAAPPSDALLLAILVMLVVVAVLLLLSLWCCCRSGKNRIPTERLAQLLSLLPHLSDIGPAVRATVTALRTSSSALGKIQEAGTALSEVPTFSATVQVVQKKSDAIQEIITSLGGGFPVQSQLGPASVSGFSTGITKITDAGGMLKDQAGNDITMARDAINAAVTLLTPIADALP
jgi:hypothetical protein